ncbi:hypothetical protein OFP24_25785, partial [Escherichia coli]|nr:hypothetical protein [Escherichia coli]
LLRQKQKKLIMLPSETMIWQPEFTDKTLSRKPGAVQSTSTIQILHNHVRTKSIIPGIADTGFLPGRIINRTPG